MLRNVSVVLITAIGLPAQSLACPYEVHDVIACVNEAKAVLSTEQLECNTVPESLTFACTFTAPKLSMQTGMAQGLLLSCIREKFDMAYKTPRTVTFLAKVSGDVSFSVHYWKTRFDGSVELQMNSTQIGKTK
jgi:hypothetical protein